MITPYNTYFYVYSKSIKLDKTFKRSIECNIFFCNTAPSLRSFCYKESMKLEGLLEKSGKCCDKKTRKADYLKRGLFRRSGLGDDVILYTVLIRLREGFKVKPRRV
jgi:hypothetical protein